MQTLYLLLLGVWLVSSLPFLVNGMVRRHHEMYWGMRPSESPWQRTSSTVQLILTALVMGPLAVVAWLRSGTAFAQARERVLHVLWCLRPEKSDYIQVAVGVAAGTIALLVWSFVDTVPCVATVDLWPADGVTELPFTVSRSSDVIGAYGWAFLLCLFFTTSVVSRAFKKLGDFEGETLAIWTLSHIIVLPVASYCDGSAICIATTVVASVLYGGLVMICTRPIVGIIAVISILLCGCLAVGLTQFGLLLTLPAALVAVPVILWLFGLIAGPEETATT